MKRNAFFGLDKLFPGQGRREASLSLGADFRCPRALVKEEKQPALSS